MIIKGKVVKIHDLRHVEKKTGESASVISFYVIKEGWDFNPNTRSFARNESKDEKYSCTAWDTKAELFASYVAPKTKVFVELVDKPSEREYNGKVYKDYLVRDFGVIPHFDKKDDVNFDEVNTAFGDDSQLP